MMTNMYDHAYDLEKTLRESDEFQSLKKLYTEIKNDEVANRMFDNFRNLQLELQEKQMQGVEISEQDAQKAQQQLQLVQQHEKISKLLEAEQRLSVVIQDINQIIAKPLEELYGQ